MMTAWEAIHDIYAGRANKRYGLTSISQAQHALQGAMLAEAQGAEPALIVATLLHDVGHMIHDLGEAPADEGVDDRHEDLGADWLADWFGPEVSEPVRLHVEAKRYLCFAEPDYLARLSDDSLTSLALQGGAMNAAEAMAFLLTPWASQAVDLRRLDEAAKDPAAVTPELSHWRRMIETLAKHHGHAHG